MFERTRFLFINVLNFFVPVVLNVLSEGNIHPTYTCINGKEDIQKALRDKSNWDLILVSDNVSKSNFPTLKYVKNHSKDIPIIFLTQAKAKEVAVPAMKNGATDCVSEDNIGRLLPIVIRELNRKRVFESYNKLENEQKVLSEVSKYSSDEIYIFSLDNYKCLYLNQSALENNGYSKEDIHQLCPADIYADYEINMFKQMLSPLIHGEREKISVCIRKKRKNILYPVKVKFRVFKWERQRYLLAINRDISSLREKTRKLKNQERLAREYSRNSKLKSDFLADAAHDMRTSLNSIILSNMLVSKKFDQQVENDLKKLTKAINQSGNYLLNYINEFFDSPTEQWNQHNMKNYIIDAQIFGEKLFYVFDPIAQKNGIQFEYKTNDLSHPKIKTNGTSLKRILKNILSNAFKYTPHGEVTLKLYIPNGEELENVEFKSRSAIAFQVEDTGIGISESEKEKIFERHSRTEDAKARDFKGSGLGLDICKQLTDTLGGQLHVESEENRGSTFTLYLPYQKSSVDNEPEKNSHNENIDLEIRDKIDETILIVDDSQAHNLATKELLSYSIENCMTANTKGQAYHILKHNNIDCIILDYLINKENCIKIMQHIRRQPKYESTPIIIYTGKKLSQSEKEQLNEYAYTIIQKNIGSHKKLTSAICSYLAPTNQI